MPAPKKAPVRPIKKGERKRVQEPFIHSLGEVNIELPSLTWINPGWVRTHRHLPLMHQQFVLMEENLDEDQLAAIDALNPEEYEDLLKKWSEHSGTDLGESQASTS